jgi:hypothetical protein
MGKPQKGPSTTDMWSDDYPPEPSKVSKLRWIIARDTLYESGDKNLMEMAKCMNIAQECYLETKSTVALKGRVFAEWFLCFHKVKVYGAKYIELKKYITRYEKQGGTKENKRHLETLRKIGNKSAHATDEKMKAEEKPKVIHAMYELAVDCMPSSGTSSGGSVLLNTGEWETELELDGGFDIGYNAGYSAGYEKAEEQIQEKWREAKRQQDMDKRKNFPSLMSALRKLSQHSDYVRCVAWSTDGKILASGSWDKTVRLWNGESGECLRILKEHTGNIHSVAWGKFRNILASGSGDRTVRIWNGESGKCLQVLKGHTRNVHSVAWSTSYQSLSQRILASASWDRTVRIWDGESGNCLQVLKGHRGSVHSVAWAPGKDILASGSADRTVRIWNGKSGECLHVITGHTDDVRCVAWSHFTYNLILASGSSDHTVRLWDYEREVQVKVLRGHTNDVRAMEWWPTGDVLATGSWDKTVRLWDLQFGRDGECVNKLTEHTSKVHSVAWRRDGNILASGSWDKTVQLWGLFKYVVE